MSLAVRLKTEKPSASWTASETSFGTISQLKRSEEPEVLDFLAARPIHTVIIASKIRQRFQSDPAEQNEFYCYRDPDGVLEGVGLFGRITLFETHSNLALISFAKLARNLPPFKVTICQSDCVDLFWEHYAERGHFPNLRCGEVLYEYYEPSIPIAESPELRLATLDDIDQVVRAHGLMIFEETGIDVLKVDAEAFRKRIEVRIAQHTVWVLIENDKLIFKADVAAETPHAIYIEGLWIDPSERRRGYGRNCLEHLRLKLASQAGSLCGFVSSENLVARSFYESAGCRAVGTYQKIYL
jgi:ribosomal protein S18 acetylase RimI-like enzyme